MSAISAIEWTDRTWNPVRGCRIVSPGCVNCYAMKQAHRFSGPGKPYEGLTHRSARSGPQWTGEARPVPSALLEPLSWREPARVFVNSMSDLFHEDVPDTFIDQVFNVMFYAPHLTFQILTKRPERMRAYLSQPNRAEQMSEGLYHTLIADQSRAVDDLICRGMDRVTQDGTIFVPWPLPNVWLGVSAEDQQRADERIPLLLQTPAVVRFVSAEPLLGPVYLEGLRDGESPGTVWVRDYLSGNPSRINWVIVGGESGHRARACDVQWVRSIVEQCQSAGVPVFVKQLGAVPMVTDAEWRGDGSSPVRLLSPRNHRKVPAGYAPLALANPKGGDPAEWPADLRVREMPRAEVPA